MQNMLYIVYGYVHMQWKCENMHEKNKHQMQGDGYLYGVGKEGKKGMESSGIHRKFQLQFFFKKLWRRFNYNMLRFKKSAWQYKDVSPISHKFK